MTATDQDLTLETDFMTWLENQEEVMPPCEVNSPKEHTQAAWLYLAECGCRYHVCNPCRQRQLEKQQRYTHFMCRRCGATDVEGYKGKWFRL